MMTYILRMKCEDQAGIVSGLGQVLDRFGCNIGQSFQFLQPASIREDDVAEIFFLRLEFTCTEQTDWPELEQELEALRSRFDADLSVRESGRAVPTILMVSKFDHCLIDILYRVQTGKLPLDIVAVVSNHAHSRADVERLGIPYYLWPVTKENKQEQEQKLEELIERSGAELVVLARQYGCYGYRRISALLRDAGWQVNDKRVHRLWRREGLKVPMKQPRRGRLWFNDGSCVRLRPEYRDHVWSYDFVHCRTDDGKVFRTLNIIDEFSRECLAIKVKRKLNSSDVMDALSDLFIMRGVPSFIRSDNGPEFVAQNVRDWIKAIGAKTVNRSGFAGGFNL